MCHLTNCLALLLLLLMVGTAPVAACFDPTKTKCKGDTPRLDPELYCCLVRRNMRRKLDSPVFTKFIDKLLFKEFCREHNVRTAETLAVYDQADFDKVDLDAFLPNYVLKSNKASGRVIPVKNGTVLGKNSGPLTEERKFKIINESLRGWGRPHYGAEKAYEHIVPKIFLEKFLDPLPDDIKVYVINRQVDLIQICRGMGVNFYDADMNLLPYRRTYTYSVTNSEVVKTLQQNPAKLAELKATALRLARWVPLDLVRVDLFLIGDEIYGGEITLSSNAGNDFIQYTGGPKRDPVKGNWTQTACKTDRSWLVGVQDSSSGVVGQIKPFND